MKEQTIEQEASAIRTLDGMDYTLMYITRMVTMVFGLLVLVLSVLALIAFNII